MRQDSNQGSNQVFKLSIKVRNPVGTRLLSHFLGPLESVVALRRLGAVYAQVSHIEDPVEFLDGAFSALRIRYDVTEKDRAHIPEKGPAIVVANHPFGAAEGLVLMSVLRSVRPDVKIMANSLLGRIPQLRDFFIFVDPYGRPESARANLKGLREAITWVKNGGMLAVFPAGDVSRFNFRSMRITDPKWSETIARLLRCTHAPALPLYFRGRNGALFQTLGLAHPLLRTAMLPRELLNKRGRIIEVRVGDIIPARKLNACESDAQMMETLRQRTYLLEKRARAAGERKRIHLPIPKRMRRPEPIIDPEPPALLEQEIDALPPEQVLLEERELMVAYASAGQIPHLLRELGRLRETTFRGAGEGTGKSIDLDRFDAYYLHLFVWNRRAREVVGAYRLGPTDQILPQMGIQGLYTSTLFGYDADLFRAMGPAVELGRSFVRPEYQRSYSSLLLLWRGIGSFVTRHPRYKLLFGPVSVSQGYQLISRQFIVSYLRENKQMHPLSRFVHARKPFRSSRRGLAPHMVRSAMRDIDDLSSFISQVEADHKGVPILLKNYLKLGAAILGFNVDPDFSNVLDVLILVDLTLTDPKVLERQVLGNPGTADFLAYHNGHSVDAREPVGV